jgi:DNA-binding CsgD family transcriptional regulator
MNNNVNANLQQIMALKKQGKSPQEVMQILMRQNPNLQQTLTQMKNMAGDRNPKEFIMQLARQNGVEEATLGMIDGMFNNQ